MPSFAFTTLAEVSLRPGTTVADTVPNRATICPQIIYQQYATFPRSREPRSGYHM